MYVGWVCASEYRCLQSPREDVIFPADGGRAVVDLPDVGPRPQTQVSCKSSACSYLPSHLSIPVNLISSCFHCLLKFVLFPFRFTKSIQSDLLRIFIKY